MPLHILCNCLSLFFSLLLLQCVPDFIGELLLIAISVAQLPVKKTDEDQQDEDEEQRTNKGPNYHSSSVRSCEISINNKELLSLLQKTLKTVFFIFLVVVCFYYLFS